MLPDKRIPELDPKATVTGNLQLPVYDDVTDTTYRIDLSQISSAFGPSNYAWNGSFSYAIDEISIYEDQIWISQQNGNLGVIPGTDVAYWVLGVKVPSGLTLWTAGIYTDAEVVKLYNTGGQTYIVRLLNPTRPFNSTNIAAELAGGDWEIVAGGTSNIAAVLGAGNNAAGLGIVNLGNVIFANNMGIDVTASGGSDVLNIGTANADVINIGRAGAQVNVIGNTFYENVTELQVKDKLFTVNKGGAAASGFGTGFEIEENAIATGYFKTNGARTGFDFKAPAAGFAASIVLNGLTAARTYTGPDIAGTFLLSGAGVVNTLTGQNTFFMDANILSNFRLEWGVLGASHYSSFDLGTTAIGVSMSYVNPAGTLYRSFSLNSGGITLEDDNGKGIQYFADYSATFTARSLVDKAYVLSVVGSSNPFSDASALVKNSADPTKLVIFSAAGVTTGTTRTLTVPNANGTLALLSDIVGPFADNIALVKNSADNTKLAIFSAASISTATTRTYTLQNASGTLAFLSDVGTLSWALTGTSTLTGIATITSNVAKQHEFAGTWTAGANNDYHMNFGGSFSARATASDFVYGYKFTPTLTSNSTSQAGIGVLINPSFVVGAGTFQNTASLQVVGKTTFSHGSVAVVGSATVHAFGTSTGTALTFAVANSASATRFSVADNGAFTFTSVINNSYIFTPTFTSAANNDKAFNFQGTITARATTSDVLNYATFASTMVTGATTQTLTLQNNVNTFTVNHTGVTVIGYDYSPTINGSQAVGTHLAFRAVSGQVLIGATTVTANALLDLKGTSTANTAYTLYARNSSDQITLAIDNSGGLVVGDPVAGGSISIQRNTATLSGGSPSGKNLWFISNTALAAADDSLFGFGRSTALVSIVAGTQSAVRAYVTFSPTSGSTTFASFRSNVTYNQTVTASGDVIGYLHDPVVNAVLGTHYSFKSTSGKAQLTSAKNDAFETLGTWTATANNQYHANFGGSFTATATASDTLIGYKFSQTMTSGGSSQSAYGVLINPTFAGSFTNPIALHVVGKTLIGGVLSVGSTTSMLDIIGSGTSTNYTIISKNSAATVRFAHTDAGVFTFTSISESLGSSYSYASTYTSTGNDRRHTQWSGTITARATASDNLYSLLNSVSLTTGSTGQFLYGYKNNGVITVNSATATVVGVEYDPTIAGSTAAQYHFAWRHNLGGIVWNSSISPAQITANTDDYNPTGWYGATILRVTTDASRNLTSLTGGTNGRIAFIKNVGSFNLVVKNDDGATGTAANRFDISPEINLKPKQVGMFIYDGTSSRWRALGNWSAVTNTAANNEVMKSDGANAVPSGIFSTTAGDITYGTGLAGATRTWTASGSAADVGVSIVTKGAGTFAVTTNSALRITLDSTGLTMENPYLFPGAGTSFFTLHTIIGGAGNTGATLLANTNTQGGLLITNDIFTNGQFIISPQSWNVAQNIVIRGSAAQSGNNNGGHVYLDGGAKTGTGLKGNVGLFSLAGSFGSGERVLFMGDCTTASSAAPVNGIILESIAGELWVRDSSNAHTLLSPHNFALVGKPSEEMSWAYFSEKTTGKKKKRINVDMLAVIREVENLIGRKLVYEDEITL